jgi:hypothetical protein
MTGIQVVSVSPMKRLLSVLLVVLMSSVVMSIAQQQPAAANGGAPAALCAEALTPLTNVGPNLFTVLTKDASTNAAVTGSALVPVRADAAVASDMQPPGRRTSSCDEVSEFDISGVEVGREFHLGVVPEEGFASQWYPSGDRARASVFRKRSDGVVEMKTFGSSSWSAVTETIEVTLNRGNSLTFGVTRAGNLAGPYSACLVIWSFLPGSSNLEYGGAFCNFPNSSTIQLRGIPLETPFLVELRNPPQGGVNPRGFLKLTGTTWGTVGNWSLARTSAEATVFRSEGDGQGVSIGGAAVNAAIPINIPATSSISGTLQRPDGSAVNDVCVYALDKSRYFAGLMSDDAADCFLTDGQWTLSGLTASDYVIYVYDFGEGILSGFYGAGGSLNSNPGNASTFTFSGPSSLSAGLAVAQPGSAVSGTFSRPSGTYEVCVTAWKESGQAGFREWVNGTCTSSNTFALTIPNGTYRFEYSERNGQLKTVWNGGVASYLVASDVVVSGPTTLPSVSLASGATIAGDLNLGGSGAFRSICVSAFDGAGSDYDWGEWLGGTCEISSSGGFSIGGLSPNSQVKIRVDSSNGVNRSAFYSNSGPVYRNSEAQVVTIASGTNSLASLTLSAGLSVSGTVTSDGTNPVQFACVSAISSSWEWLGGTCSGVDGKYSLSGLPVDSNMRIRVEGPRSSPSLGGGWLAGPAGGWSVTNSAQSIDVSQSLVNVTVALRAARMITGTVTTSAGVNPPPTCVSAFIATSFQWAGRSCTDRQYKYTIGGLPNDQSFVLLVEPQPSSGYRTGWLETSASNVTTSASGSLLTVSSFTASSATQNFTLASPPSGTIFGVAELSGKPLTGIIVMAKIAGSAATSSAVALTVTGAGGNFTLSGLQPGSYDVYLIDSQASPRIVPFVQPGRSTSATLWKPNLTGVNS